MDTPAKADPNPKPTKPDEPEFDLYTIPGYSSWFKWDDIHTTEKQALNEFFNGTSITRTPKIYKEYRDFIINKYREDPSRRLTFTDIRKSLVADVNLLHKVFRFLENWGLINFSAKKDEDEEEEEGRENLGQVKFEDGPPNGVRVVSMPNSLKPVGMRKGLVNGGVKKVGIKLPGLASYTDVFGECGRKRKRGLCGNCGGSCESGAYEYVKGDYTICVKCFEDGKFGEDKSKEDFKSVDDSGKLVSVWTEEETLLLLESVMKNGDDWDLVAQDVKTKSKLDCISKVIEMPFGDLIPSNANSTPNSIESSAGTNSLKQVSSSEPPVPVKSQGQSQDTTNMIEQNGNDIVQEDFPLKRQRITSLSDANSSLMNQVSLLSTVAGSDIMVSAADTAISALCNETSFPREIFEDEEFLTNALSTTLHSETERANQTEDTEMKEAAPHPDPPVAEDTSLTESRIPLTLQLRAATGTAFGAAAARAKLLADQEDREIASLVATIIEAQLKKLECKMKYVDDLETIMEKEHAELDEIKECLIEERIDALSRAIRAGVSKWRDYTCVRSYNGAVV